MTLALALDTATDCVSVGLAEVDATTGAATMLARRVLDARRAANSTALPIARELLRRSGRRACEIGLVVAGRGPGSFTGVRIGLATAKGVAHALGVALVAVPTADAVVYNARDLTAIVGVVGDAMRGEVYPVLYRVSAEGIERLSEIGVARPAEVAARWAASAPRPSVLIGNGLAKYADDFTRVPGWSPAILTEDSWSPTPEGLLAAAAGSIAAALSDPSGYDPGVALPIYTRLSDAEEAEADRLGLDRSVPDSGVSGSATGAETVAGSGAGWPYRRQGGIS